MNIVLSTAAKISKALAIATANTTCVCLLHQPKLPESVKKLCKEK